MFSQTYAANAEVSTLLYVNKSREIRIKLLYFEKYNLNLYEKIPNFGRSFLKMKSCSFSSVTKAKFYKKKNQKIFQSPLF